VLTEADTCTRYVVPNLRNSRWDDAPHSFAQEHSFTDEDDDLKEKQRGFAGLLVGAKEDLEHLPPEKLVESIVEKEMRILEIMGEIKALLAEGPKA
jgi:hypothetical protein